MFLLNWLWWIICLVGLVVIWRKKFPMPIGVKDGKTSYITYEKNPATWLLILVGLGVLIVALAIIDYLLAT